MSASGWKLYYWPVLAGRAEFIRIIFEEAGVPFEEINEGIQQMFSWRQPVGGKVHGWPALAVPFIENGNFQLAQTPAICRYLGKQFGLYPDGGDEEEARADQVNFTIHDYIAEGRNSFHGKNFYDSFYTQQEETKPYIEYFIKNRLPKFLNHFEQVLQYNDGGQGFVIGKKLTYVDLGLLHVLRATAAQFPKEWEMTEGIPLLRAFKERLEARPRLAEYFKSSRCRPFEGNSMM